MKTKNVLYIVGGLALAYFLVYRYQRYKRQKSNETPVSYDQSLQILNDLEKDESIF